MYSKKNRFCLTLSLLGYFLFEGTDSVLWIKIVRSCWDAHQAHEGLFRQRQYDSNQTMFQA
jgi:hypothetical protein